MESLTCLGKFICVGASEQLAGSSSGNASGHVVVVQAAGALPSPELGGVGCFSLLMNLLHLTSLQARGQAKSEPFFPNDLHD